jgi:hypothetical protein
MELKTFIEETIKAVTDGIRAGDKHIKQATGQDDVRFTGTAMAVTFDIGVSVNNAERGSVGAGIKVVEIFNAGGNTESEKSSTLSNRIQFTVHLFIGQHEKE